METLSWMFKLFDGVSKPAGDIDKSLKRIEDQLGKLPTSAEIARRGFDLLFEGARRLADLSIEGGKFLVDTVAFKENTLVAFQTILGTKEEASKLFKVASDFGRLTPFETTDVVKSFKQLLGGGLSKKEVPIVFQALGDVASLSGGGAQSLEMMGADLNKMLAGGSHVIGHSLRGLVLNSGGIVSEDKVYENLAKIYGVDPAATREMVSKGQVQARDVVVAFLRTVKQITHGELGQAMLDQSTTITGLLSTIKSAASDLIMNIDLDNSSGFKGFKQFLSNVADVLNPDTTSGKKLIGVIEKVMDSVGGFLGSFTPDAIVDGFGRIVNVVSDLVDGFGVAKETIVQMVQPTLDLFSEMNEGIGTSMTIQDVFHTIGVVVGGLINGFLVLAEIGKLVWDGLAAFGDIDYDFLVDQLKDVGVDLMKGLRDGIVGAAHWALQALTDVGMDAVRQLKDVLGIHSPSRVFMGLGRYTAEGFALGVGDGSGEVDAAINGIVGKPSVGRGGGGGTVTVNLSVNVDAQGNDAEGIARKLTEILPTQVASLFEQLAMEDGAA